jgi:6-phosphogluconolactonase
MESDIHGWLCSLNQMLSVAGGVLRSSSAFVRLKLQTASPSSRVLTDNPGLFVPYTPGKVIEWKRGLGDCKYGYTKVGYRSDPSGLEASWCCLPLSERKDSSKKAITIYGGMMKKIVLVIALWLIAALPAQAGFLYALVSDSAANGGNRIYGYRVDEGTGALTLLTGFPVLTGYNGNAVTYVEQTSIWYDAANARLFVANTASNNINAYSVSRTTGALAPLPYSPIAVSFAPTNVLVHPSGSPLIVGNTAGMVESFNITATAATPASGSPFAATAVVSGAFSRDGSYLYLGSNGGASLFGYSVNAATGVLTPLAGSPYTMSGVTHVGLAVDVAGRIFSANFTTGNLGIYSTTSGIPAEAAASPVVAGFTSPVAGILHPGERFYFVAGRSGNVGVYGITGTGSGTLLTPVAGSPFSSGGNTPNAIALNAGGNFVFAANAGSRNISTWGFNSTTSTMSGLPIQAPNSLGTTGFITGLSYLPDPSSVAVPTLSQWALVFLAGLLLISAGWAVSQRRS